MSVCLSVCLFGLKLYCHLGSVTTFTVADQGATRTRPLVHFFHFHAIFGKHCAPLRNPDFSQSWFCVSDKKCLSVSVLNLNSSFLHSNV